MQNNKDWPFLNVAAYINKNLFDDNEFFSIWTKTILLLFKTPNACQCGLHFIISIKCRCTDVNHQIVIINQTCVLFIKTLFCIWNINGVCTNLFPIKLLQNWPVFMHRSAKYQTPPNAVDLLWSREGLWMGLSFVFSRSDGLLTT